MQSKTMATWLGVSVAGVAGVAALAASYAMGLPGDGTFLVVAALAGLVAGLAAPGLAGYVVLVGAIALPAMLEASTREFAGLWALVIASIVVPASAGWLVGAASGGRRDSAFGRPSWTRGWWGRWSAWR